MDECYESSVTVPKLLRIGATELCALPGSFKMCPNSYLSQPLAAVGFAQASFWQFVSLWPPQHEPCIPLFPAPFCPNIFFPTSPDFSMMLSSLQ